MQLSVLASWFRRTPTSERELLHRCAGDKAQMERLIEHELQRRPGMLRETLSRSALERWTRVR
jgi:hypothetical protein